MQNLERRPSGVYVARLTIPTRLRGVVGATVFVESTGSRSLQVAKVVASERIARWRRHLFELERLSLLGSAMTQESILKIADGHPLLLAGGHLPLRQAAAVIGLGVQDLLRRAAGGELSLYCRLQGEIGYQTPFGSFEPDDPQLGTVIVPRTRHRPSEARIHRAFGIHKIQHEEVAALANELLIAGSVPVLAFEVLPETDDRMAFVPEAFYELTEERVEVSAVELDAMRRKIAEAISPAALEAARQSLRQNIPVSAATGKSSLLLSAGADEYCRTRLPQSISSPKEITRIRNGLHLLAEFEGDLRIGDVSTDTLRHFRDTHLPRMPANENQVRLAFKTSSMTESVLAVESEDWPRMSAGERDMRMQWLYRMFKWFHAQKWIPDDPGTGLRGESVLTKVERKQAAAARKEREEFTAPEVVQIFTAPVYDVGQWKATKAGTFRTFQPFHYWLPLLGFFTGARIGELCQLHLDDVRREEGAWFVDINESSADKSLKNAWSTRRVPLHPRLEELGFFLWCDELRRQGFRRVFPELSWNPTNRYAKEPIRAMSQFLEGLGLPRDGTKVFHSFRHRMNNYLQKHTAMPDIMRKRVMGHERGEGVNERHYLSDSTPKAVLAFMTNIDDGLPPLAPFNVDVGSIAVKDALRRKNGGRGAPESLGGMES